jgi:hypothetical protein
MIKINTIALLKLAELRIKNPKDEGLKAIADYINYLESELAKFSTTHMSEVWKENERLKSKLDLIMTKAIVYKLDPINIYNRVESWQKLERLVEAALSALEGGQR